jgi:hypothetical protein
MKSGTHTEATSAWNTLGQPTTTDVASVRNIRLYRHNLTQSNFVYIKDDIPKYNILL